MDIAFKDVIWPLTVVALFLLFYRPISRLIESITSLSRKGVQIDFGKPQQQKQVIEPDMKLSEEFDPVLIKEIEKLIEQDLNLANIEDEEEKIKRLKKYATIKEITARYQTLYSIIFGSQLRLLQHLNFRRGVGETKDNLKKNFYDAAATIFPDFYKTTTFDEYFNFLVTFSLITTLTGDNYGITVYGKDFLAFLVRQGQPFDKQF